MRVVWTPEAQQDRGDVWDYIAADNPRAAARKDLRRCGEASRAPHAGTSGKDIRHLRENFETADLLRAADSLDNLRDDLNDGEECWPPELRTNLLKLHQLAMAVVNNGSCSQASGMFELAKFVALYPESLSDANLEGAD